VVFWGVGVWYVGELRVDGGWMRKKCGKAEGSVAKMKAREKA